MQEHIDLWGSWTEIGMIAAAIIMGAIIVVIPYIKKCRYKRRIKIGPGFTQIHSQLHEELTKVRLMAKGARVYIAQFHNGGEFLDGSSIRKWSITHESVRSGIKDSIHETQNIIATRYPDLIELLYNNEGSILITSLLPDEGFSSIKNLMYSKNVVGFAVFPLRDIKAINLIGFLCVEWLSMTKLDELNDEDEIKLQKVITNTQKVIEGRMVNQKNDYR